MLDNAIKVQCWNKINELLEKHFGSTLGENEVLDARYTLDYPFTVASEMEEYLVSLWSEIGHTSGKTIEEIMGAGRLSSLTYDSYLDMLKEAQADASRITLWEKIAKTNHDDVMVFKSIMKSCTKDILELMVKDFLNE